MHNRFHVSWCPFCNQGWVEIIKDSGNNKLLLLCSECDTIWNEPADIKLDKPIIDYIFSGKLVIPSTEEITEIGWNRFLIS